MKIGIALQVVAVLYQYRIVNAIFGFGGKPEDPKRIRIYLEDDEKLLVPKDSKVEYVSPIIEEAPEMYMEHYPMFPSYMANAIKKPLFLPSAQSYYHQNQVPLGIYEKPTFTLENLRINSAPSEHYYGSSSYLGGHGVQEYGHSEAAATDALLQSQVKQSPVAYGKLLRPILLLPNGWIQGVNIEGGQHVKPVTEERPDDFKFDFRTQTHSLK